MNPTDHTRTTGDDALLDLLVDGELNDTERRALLARLDTTPDGWRRCAMAFLESQCWQQGLSGFRREAEPAPRPGRKPPWGLHTGTLAAMAASFLLALLLGMTVRQAWQPEPQPGPTPIAAVEPPVPEPEEPIPPVAPVEEAVRYVALPVSGTDGTPDSVRLPVTESESVDEAWLRALPAAVPDDLREALLEAGHQVQQQRRVMPLRMRDGRRLIVPYDEVEIRYVGGQNYQ